MVRFTFLSLLSSLLLPSTLAQRPTRQVAHTVPGAYIAEFANAETSNTFYAKLGEHGHAVSHRMDLYVFTDGLRDPHGLLQRPEKAS